MKPVLQALVLAERIYTDHPSGKKIICGTFNQIMVAQIRAPELKNPEGSVRQLVAGGTDPGCPSAYISLTDVVHDTELAFQFVNMSKNTIVFSTALRLNVTDRLATIELIVPLPPMGMLARDAGTFSLDVVWNGEILGSHRLIVKRAEAHQEAEE